jgi:hypothetical protein
MINPESIERPPHDLQKDNKDKRDGKDEKVG